MEFPEREQMSHVDIHAGMMFYFVRNPNLKPGEKPLFTDPDPVFWSEDVPWIVIGKEYDPGMPDVVVKGYWRYLLLGPGPTLRWHMGSLGWVRRVADPVWEERERNRGRDRHDTAIRRA